MHAQFSHKQFLQLCYCREHYRKYKGALSMNFNADVFIHLKYQYFTLRDHIKPVSEVMHNKRCNLVNLRAAQGGRLEHAMPISDQC